MQINRAIDIVKLVWQADQTLSRRRVINTEEFRARYSTLLKTIAVAEKLFFAATLFSAAASTALFYKTATVLIAGNHFFFIPLLLGVASTVIAVDLNSARWSFQEVRIVMDEYLGIKSRSAKKSRKGKLRSLFFGDTTTYQRERWQRKITVAKETMESLLILPNFFEWDLPAQKTNKPAQTANPEAPKT